MKPADPSVQGYIVAALGAVVVVAAVVWFTNSGSEAPATAEQPRTEASGAAPSPAPTAPSR